MAEITIDGVTFGFELAEIANSITEEEWAEIALVNDVSDQIAAYMDAKGITRAMLAERMGTSRAFVTKVLAGNANLTLKTFAKVLFHLEARPEIKIVAQKDQFQWFGLVTNQKCALEVRSEPTKRVCIPWEDSFSRGILSAA